MTSRASPADSVDAATRAHVVAWLQRVEAEAGVRVLYAAESGSRAWGFASPDSDYDVRFIYAHPRDWYVSLTERRDVIERPLDEKLVDLVGWDLRKALRLALKSNPAFYEWLVSPVVYVPGSFRDEARTFFEAHADIQTLARHYDSIARSQWRNIGDGADVKLKRYFYVLRPLFSIEYLCCTRGALPPMNLQELSQAIDLPVAAREDLDALLELKRVTPELGLRQRRPELDQWIRTALERSGASIQSLSRAGRDSARADNDADALFRRLIGV